ncbi:hypothetical protein [Nakamurella sp.]|uniref:hypothetical protein n=1 Tax=Nakamurella sp. TaxID=1869182 RepID=UPI003783E290
MTVFEVADTAANPAAIRAAAAELDHVVGSITGHGQAVTTALLAIPANFSELFAPEIRARAQENEAAWRQGLSSVVYAAGVTRMWASDVEWFKQQRAALSAQVSAATAGTAGLTPPVQAPDATPEAVAAAAQQFAAAVDARQGELAADGSRAGTALLQQLQERAAQRAADLRSGPTPATLSRLDAAGVLPAAAGVIFAATGWTPVRSVSDLVAMVAAGLLPGSALQLSWPDLIDRAKGAWAHLLDRLMPTIPDDSPLAGIFHRAVDPLTMGPTLRAAPTDLASAFASMTMPVALLLGALYPRLLANASGVPSTVQAVASKVLQAAGASRTSQPSSGGGGRLTASAMPDLAASNTSLIGRLASKVLSNETAAEGYFFLLTAGKNFLAGKPWPGPGPAPWLFNGPRHNVARDEAVKLIQKIAEHGGNPLNVTIEYKIPGASKELTGNKGFADIAYRIDPVGNQKGQLFLWEVKGTTDDTPPFVNQANTAAAEVAAYVRSAQQMQGNARYDVQPGFAMNDRAGFFFKDPDGITRYYVVQDGDGPGAIVYGPGSFVVPSDMQQPTIRQDMLDPPLWSRILDQALPFPQITPEQLEVLLPYGSFPDEHGPTA